jgi:hypothetical protein
MTALTDEKLAALDAVVAKATPGEWLSHSRYEESAAIPFSINGKSIGLCWRESLDGTKFDCEANAAAIVALHNAYPALRATINAERARADVFATEIEALRAQVLNMAQQHDQRVAELLSYNSEQVEIRRATRLRCGLLALALRTAAQRLEMLGVKIKTPDHNALSLKWAAEARATIGYAK